MSVGLWTLDPIIASILLVAGPCYDLRLPLLLLLSLLDGDAALQIVQ